MASGDEWWRPVSSSHGPPIRRILDLFKERALTQSGKLLDFFVDDYWPSGTLAW